MVASTSTELNNTVALVTGINKQNGIGRAIVHALIENGAKKVCAAARKVEQLDDLVAQYEQGAIVPVALDVTDLDAVRELPSKHQDVNMVFNNAGHGAMTSSLDDVLFAQKEIQINCIAPLAIVQAFAKDLKKHSENGQDVAIVNVNSVASCVNFPLAGTCSATKAATHSLTQAQRRDMPFAKVIGVCPGPIDTDMAKDIDIDKASPSDVAKAILDALTTKDGVDEVFPDAMALQMHQGWKADAKAMELQMTASVTQSSQQARRRVRSDSVLWMDKNTFSG